MVSPQGEIGRVSAFVDVVSLQRGPAGLHAASFPSKERTFERVVVLVDCRLLRMRLDLSLDFIHRNSSLLLKVPLIRSTS